MCFIEKKSWRWEKKKKHTKQIVFIELATHYTCNEKKNNEILIFTYWISYNMKKTGDLTIDDLCL